MKYFIFYFLKFEVKNTLFFLVFKKFQICKFISILEVAVEIQYIYIFSIIIIIFLFTPLILNEEYYCLYLFTSFFFKKRFVFFFLKIKVLAFESDIIVIINFINKMIFSIYSKIYYFIFREKL